jgi:hypothetical protein
MKSKRKSRIGVTNVTAIDENLTLNNPGKLLKGTVTRDGAWLR